MTAREEFGLRTRDAVLQETALTQEMGDNWPYAVEVNVATDDVTTIYILRWSQDGPKEVFRREVRVPRSERLEEMIVVAEGWSTREFVDLLLAGGYQPRPRPLPEQPTPPPEENGGLAAALDPVLQFAAVRQLHDRLAAGQDSAEVRTALARSYALLGSLTELHWSVGHKAFKARALLLSQTAARRWPNEPIVWWSRAYARALCGLHQPAVDDLERARKFADSQPPTWAPGVEAFCRWDADWLAAQREFEPALTPYLELLAAEIAGTDSQRIALAESLWETSRQRCFRAAARLATENAIGVRTAICGAQMREYAEALPESLSAVPSLPDSVLQLMAERRNAAGGEAPTWRADLVRALLDAGNAEHDSGQPSWQVLARVIDDTTFLHVVSLLGLYRSKLGVDTLATLDEVRPLLRNHPLAAGIDCFSSDAAHARTAAQQMFPLLDRLEFSEGGRLLLNRVHPYRATTKITDRILQQRDDTVPDRVLRLRAIPSGAGAAQELAVLRRLAPDCPIVAAATVELNWTRVSREARSWEQRYAKYPDVIGNLAEQYEKSDRPEDAERCLKQLTVISPEPKNYQRLATFYEVRENWEAWKEVQKSLIRLPAHGLEQASAASRLAYWFMERGQWEDARPHADLAAGSHSAWGLKCGAECYEGLREWEKAEALIRACSERYTSSEEDWYFWCRRTGHGDSAAARKLAEHSLTSTSLGEEASRLRRAVILELEGDVQAAFDLYLAAVAQKDTNYYRMLAALAAHKLGRQRDRDQLFARIAVNSSQTCLPYLCRSLLRGLEHRQPPASDDELEFYSALDLEPGVPSNCFYFVAKYLQILGEEQRAVLWLQRCASSSLRNKLTVTLAGAELVQLRREVPARRSTEFDLARRKVIGLLREGHRHFNDKQHEQALRSYTAAVAAAPDWPIAHYGRALSLHWLDRLDEAESEYSAVIERVDRMPELHIVRAKVREDLRNYAGAIADYQRALQVNPEDRRVHRNYGWLLAACPDQRVRNGQLALEHAQLAQAEAGANDWSAVALRAAAHAELGEFTKAVALQEAALALAPLRFKEEARDQLRSYRDGLPYRLPDSRRIATP